VCKSLHESEKAIEFYEKAILLKGRIGDRRGECDSTDRLAVFCSSIGRFKKAELYQLRALEISRANGDRTEQGRHESNLGQCPERFPHESYKECYENALLMSRENGDVKQEAVSLGNLGSAYLRLGDFLKALEFHTKAFEIRTRIGDKQGEAYPARQRFLALSSRLSPRRKSKEPRSRWVGEATHLGNLGTPYHAIGRYAKAAEHHEKALQIHRHLNDKKRRRRELWKSWRGLPLSRRIFKSH